MPHRMPRRRRTGRCLRFVGFGELEVPVTICLDMSARKERSLVSGVWCPSGDGAWVSCIEGITYHLDARGRFGHEGDAGEQSFELFTTGITREVCGLASWTGAIKTSCTLEI